VLDFGIKPHLAAPDNAPARRFIRSDGYRVSQVIRKRVEEIFGWGKSVAGLRRTSLKGRRRTWDGSYLIMAAYNLTRMTRLLRAAAA
jgi:transposase InsO family protein